MALGAGRYDKLCTAARKGAGPGCGAVLIVIGDKKEDMGFSCQLNMLQLLALPGMLRNIADQVEQDAPKDVVDLHRLMSSGEGPPGG